MVDLGVLEASKTLGVFEGQAAFPSVSKCQAGDLILSPSYPLLGGAESSLAGSGVLNSLLLGV